ncbi:UDP-N-acetylmuramate--L-alanine ligase [bacterium]|nr:UDP-N-acetylmuramate--L-alanine ligase [bacterium]
MNLDKYKKVFVIGIGGIGVSAIAKMMLALGKEVYGSDSCQTDLTRSLEKEGVHIFYKQEAVNLDQSFDLVIYSPAILKTNPELKKACRLKIKSYSHFEFLGELSKDYTTIAISGTHGKSTTTTLLSMMMINAGLDPTIFVGSKICSLNTNFRLGKSKYLIIEADEYNRKMLKLYPDYIGLPALDKDHLDVYGSLKNIKKSFQKFIDKLNNKTNLVYNIDDVNIKDLKLSSKAYSIGLTSDATLHIENVKKKYYKQYFDLCLGRKKLCKIETKLPGFYNIYNILIASGLALQLGVKSSVISKTVREFQGLWRRFELLGKLKTNLIFSDYAHHPTEIKALLYGVRDFYANKKIVIIFQPHQEDRTEKLFDEFVDSFKLADDIILFPVYKVSGRRSKNAKSSYDLFLEIRKNHLSEEQNIFYNKTYPELKKQISKYKDAVILVVGAGDIDDFGRNFLSLKK